MGDRGYAKHNILTHTVMGWGGSIANQISSFESNLTEIVATKNPSIGEKCMYNMFELYSVLAESDHESAMN